MHYLRAVVIVVLMSVCSNPGPTTAKDAAANAALPAGERADAASAVDEANAPEVAPVATSEPTGPAPAKLALDGEGLRSFAIANGSSRPIAFGAMRAEAMRVLEAVQGLPASDQGENIDCGASHAT